MNKFVSLFSGAGGLDLGLTQSGWECAYASDIDPEAMQCLSDNFRKKRRLKTPYLETVDVRGLTGQAILEKSGLRRGDVRLLAGGPPCQSWSSAGHQLGLLDPRGLLFKDYVRIANQLDLELILFENVRGLLTARGHDGVPGSALEMVRNELLNAGFQTDVRLLNAADYGVPQRRVRLFIIGYRPGVKIAFPTETYTKSNDCGRKRLKPWKTLRECLKEIQPVSDVEIIRPRGKLAEELQIIEPGSGVKSPGKKEATRPGGHWGYKQGAFVADPDLPARTVTASGQQDWVRDPENGLRRLCPRECAAIQSFPAYWKFSGNLVTQYRLIGNAVPPQLGKRLGQVLKSTEVKPEMLEGQEASALMPLLPKLQAAIIYTKKEEARNGPSRRAAPAKKRARNIKIAAE